MAILLYVESLEDNEALFVENARQFTRVIGPDCKSIMEVLEKPKHVSEWLFFNICIGYVADGSASFGTRTWLYESL